MTGRRDEAAGFGTLREFSGKSKEIRRTGACARESYLGTAVHNRSLEVGV
jgi:hypothetical protein